MAVVGDVIPLHELPAEVHVAGTASFGTIETADVVFGDFEVPLTTRGEPWEKVVSYRADKSMAYAARALGLDVVSLANNQTMNYGLPGLADTIEALEGAGIRHVGAAATWEDAMRPTVLTVQDMRLAFLAFTCVAPIGWAATAERAGLAVLRVRTAYEPDVGWESEEPGLPPRVRTWIDESELDRATSAVQMAAANADAVLISVHWGVGTMAERAEYQQQLARALVEGGASVVLGNHPPPLQGLEVWGGGLISYSQGTFVRQQPQAGRGEFWDLAYARMPRDSCVLTVELDGAQVVAATVHPGRLGPDGICRPAARDEARRIVAAIVEESVGLDGHLVARDDRLELDFAGDHAIAGPLRTRST